MEGKTLIGNKLGRHYELLELIGEGGMVPNSLLYH